TWSCSGLLLLKGAYRREEAPPSFKSSSSFKAKNSDGLVEEVTFKLKGIDK
ncbi:Hypothetical protein FKW44_009130, partial [Caligus rogercresseyi]